MPACLAASMMVVPRGTVTVAPSMVRVTRSWVMAGPLRPGQRGPPGPREVGLELAAELLDPAHHRRGAGVAQHADGLAGHVLREVEEEVEIAGLALAAEDPLQRPHGPGGALPAL